MKKMSLQPPQLFLSGSYGFSQVVVAPPGRHVFISGQVAWDVDEQIVGPGDLAMQARQAIANLAHAMAEAGGTLEDVTALRIYKVRYERADGPVIGAVLREFFGTDSPPAATWISVDGLANEDFLIEIEAQAVIPE